MDFFTTKIWTRLVTEIILVLGMSPGSQQLSRSHILASLTLHLANSPAQRGTYMANFYDECFIYWNQRRYKRLVIWYLRTNDGRFQSAAGDYQYKIFTEAIDMDLNHQESDHHVWYQAPHTILPDDQDAEVPISLSDERDKINEEKISNLVDMTPEKPTDPKHAIESDQ